jgi:hypothetical protein
MKIQAIKNQKKIKKTKRNKIKNKIIRVKNNNLTGRNN